GAAAVRRRAGAGGRLRHRHASPDAHRGGVLAVCDDHHAGERGAGAPAAGLGTGMNKLVPRHSAAGLIVAPTIWLFYFVASFLVVGLGCENGWQQTVGPFRAQRLTVWMIALLSLALLAYATYESWHNLRAAAQAREEMEEDARERQRFLAHAGLFLCGISLLGVLWGSVNLFAFDSCAS